MPRLSQKARAEKAEQAAKDHVKGYKPKSGKVFEGARGFVEAQFDLLAEVQEAYERATEDRKTTRDQLRALYRQGLLNKSEAIDLFTIFPHRERPDSDTTEDTTEDTAEGSENGTEDGTEPDDSPEAALEGVAA